jgi:hypothetical protein
MSAASRCRELTAADGGALKNIDHLNAGQQE